MSRLRIFPRLIIAYMAILMPIIAVSGYTIFQLEQFGNVTNSILYIDNRITDYEKKITDSLLSQIRYERKYVITKDESLYDQFLSAKEDFIKYLDEAIQLSDTPQKRDLLEQIRDGHTYYQSLFDREVEYLRAGRRYRQDRYKQDKQGAIEEIMEGLKKLRADSRLETYDKIKQLGDAGSRTSRLAVVMIAAALFWGIAAALIATRGITKPLHKVMNKTKEISDGVFEGDLKLSSPPEIGELARAFNSMCDKLNEIDKMKSDFFSSMSHELRTPLTSIKEGTNLLLEGIGGEISEKQKRLLTIISEESNRLIDLVNSLLDLSKIEAGMMPFNFAVMDMKPLINKAASETEPLAAAKNIDLKMNISQDLPIIKMDDERILQVLRNLIGNAIKFTPSSGNVTISAQTDGGGIKVSVADTGPGIPKESLTTVFDKFEQTAIEGYSRIEGTGLGLAIVKHIIVAHGGRLWAESELGRGSIFIFVLPV
jgi:two-component system sensor histidine kinase GlrK